MVRFLLHTVRSRRFRPAVETLEGRLTPAVTFATQQTFAVGAGPDYEAVGDFNGDGRPDLVVVNNNDKTVSVLLNTTPAGASTPTYAAQQTFAVGTGPFGVAVADFNGDGLPDIAVVNNTDKTVSVLLNTTPAGAGSVSFAAQKTFAVGGGPFYVAAADFNGDGRPDLAVTNSADKTVSVLLNTTAAGAAAPTFAAQVTFAVGTTPYSIAAGDFNGDGRPDLAVANFTDKTVSVLLNTTVVGASTPTFAAQQTFAVGGGPYSIAVADYNADGRPDLAVTNSNDKTVSVLLNTTTAGASAASFAAQATFAVGGSPLSVVAGDFDGDGRPDLATANFADKTVSVLLNTAKVGAAAPTFAGQLTFAVGTNPYAVAAGDFSGDGRPDLVAANFGDKAVSVLLNTTAPFSSTVPTVVAQFGSTGVWEFNRVLGIWAQLTAANASVLVADPQGDVAAEFPGNGVWLYRPSVGFKQINGVDATLLAMDPLGDVVAQFPGYGVGQYLPAAGWRSLTAANASMLAVDGVGDVVAEFPGNGVWEFRASFGFKQINGVDATTLAVDAVGDVAANFKGFGVGEYRPAGGWQIINGVEAISLSMDQYGNVTAEFRGYGVGEYLAAFGWHAVIPALPTPVAVEANGDLFAEFPGFGVWEYDLYRGWTQLRTTDASLLAVA